MKLLAETRRTEVALAIQDANGGVESARLDLSQFLGCSIVLRMETGLATDAQFTLQQHDAAAAGNSKDLVSTLPHYYKVDASTEYTRVDAGSVAAKDVADLDTAAGYIVIDVDPSDLDVNSDYRWLSVQVGNPGAVRNVHAAYHCEAKNQSAHSVSL